MQTLKFSPDTDAVVTEESSAEALPTKYEHGWFAVRVHMWLDHAEERTKSSRNPRGNQTFVYEARVVRAREVLLATLTAIVTWTSWQASFPVLLSLLFGLSAFDTRREMGSINGRHVEKGNKADPLPAGKQLRMDQLIFRDRLLMWSVPALLNAVNAWNAGGFTAAIVVGVFSTYLRAVWDLTWMPAWRVSRVAWKAVR
jgi:hypothetical protein